jgi:hypothetical protein
MLLDPAMLELLQLMFLPGFSMSLFGMIDGLLDLIRILIDDLR